jgi:hypothetical protein
MGFGMWDFLPFNYPPWVELFAVPLLPLGYVAAKSAWVVLSFLALLLAGLVLRDTETDMPTWAPCAVAVFFAPGAIAACQGQTSPQMLCALAIGLWALRNSRDRAAGAALAWATLKPHLAAIPVGAVLLWSMRQRRWRVISAFACALAALVLISAIFVPNWPMKMLGAIRHSPLPTETLPQLGATWPLVLRTLGLRGAPLYAASAALALPVAGMLARLIWNRASPPADPLALGIIAAFLVAPYGRVYDYALLVLPLLELGRGVRGRLLVAILVTSVWAFLGYLPSINDNTHIPGEGQKFYTFFWVPLAILAAWLWARPRQQQQAVPPEVKKDLS